MWPIVKINSFINKYSIYKNKIVKARYSMVDWFKQTRESWIKHELMDHHHWQLFKSFLSFRTHFPCGQCKPCSFSTKYIPGPMLLHLPNIHTTLFSHCSSLYLNSVLHLSLLLSRIVKRLSQQAILVWQSPSMIHSAILLFHREMKLKCKDNKIVPSNIVIFFHIVLYQSWAPNKVPITLFCKLLMNALKLTLPPRVLYWSCLSSPKQKPNMGQNTRPAHVLTAALQSTVNKKLRANTQWATSFLRVDIYPCADETSKHLSMVSYLFFRFDSKHIALAY